MNEAQHEIILAALADKIKEQETTIALQKWQIEKLENALKDAEKQALDKVRLPRQTLEIR